MSFLLGNFKELNYNELIEINGGCAGTVSKVTPTGIKTIIDKIVKGDDSSPKGVPNPGKGADGITVYAGSTSSGTCGGTSDSKTSVSSGSNMNPNNDKELNTFVPSTTNGCSGSYVSYHSQLMFTDKNMKDGSTFAKTACGTTSIVNEISEQYTKETGKTLTDAQVIAAVKKAVEAGKIDGTDAFVNDWGEAADAIGKALGMKGTWSYTTDASKATSTIISIDTKTNERDYDGYHDHFVNDIGNGQYYDPYTNKIGNISDLRLTSEWKDNQSIKSAYRYLTYSTTK